jgi:hypothetical protein
VVEAGTGRTSSNNDDFDPKTDETMKQLEKWAISKKR